MAIKVERRDGGPERAVVIGCLTSRVVLGAVAVRWEPGLFPSRWASLLVGWAVEHYRKYRRAPGRDIAGYFDAWAAENPRERETVEAVERLLVGLSEEYEALKRSTSPDYLLDVAAKLFNAARVSGLRSGLEADLESGVSGVDAALSRIDKFRKVELGLGSGVDVMADREAMAAAFADRGEPVVVYPDAVGGFFADTLSRDSFVSFMAAEKKGKSFWLQDIAYRAVEQDRNVAYFEVGDMSQSQVLRRLAARACNRPLDARRYYYPVEIESPEKDKAPELRTELRETTANLTAAEASRALAKLEAAGRPGRFKLSCHPNSSISVAGLEAIMDGWARDDWVPDVIVVDYADILAPQDGKQEARDQINATWKALRGMSQRRHALVVTATQSDAASYEAKILKRTHFSEDKRKYAHVTGMVGINQTAEEKKDGLYRLNFVVLRELEFSETKVVWTAGCLSVANPAILSTF